MGGWIQPMSMLLIRFGAWRLAWTALACGVVLIVMIAPAFGASPQNGDDEHQSCAVAGVTPTTLPTPRVTPTPDVEDEDAGTDADRAEADQHWQQLARCWQERFQIRT